ncbi:MAG: endo-1,4-beta-xylanase [Kiritimatiellia bacterium]|jgi:GH35 family endo-1,4-beta-xylanase|nr:endo-1,4-beta-xylanase [Kiritimatiellia bacterium]
MNKYFLSSLVVMSVFGQVLLNAVQAAPAASPENLLESAPARIEKHRKGDVRLSLIGQNGKPLAGATVRVRQVRHEFLFGGSVFPLVYELQGGNLELPFKEGEPLQLFSKRYTGLFNFATLPYYWWGYEKERGKPVHESRERIAAWCKDQNVTTKGHPLVWNYSQLPWLPDDLAEVERLQLAHVGNCVERFRGKIDMWDVVNETTNFAQGPNKKRAPTVTAMWEKVGRIELPRRAFRTARKANPNATLVINDFHVGDDFAEVVRGVVDENGKPFFDVIGLQSHMHGGNWSNTKLWNVCERFAPFKKPIHFTELTILSGKKGWHRPKPWASTPEGEKEQAREVKRIYTVLFSHPSVEAITWWNLTDRHAWMQAPSGLLHKDMSPKPAYNVLVKLIKKDWWTETDLTTDADGTATFRGFYGEYELTIEARDGSRKLIRNLEMKKSPQQKPTSWMVDCSP